MYGVVNKAIEGLVTEKFGQKTWEEIKAKAGLHIEFVSKEMYDDAVTYSLIVAATEVLQMPTDKILNAFGNYWIMNTGLQHYGSMMRAGGKTLKEFMINLPAFHSRVMLHYPDITPPEFRIEEIDEKSFNVYYYSEREGLVEFTIGLLHGLAKMFNEKIETTILQHKNTISDPDIIFVKMLND
jgi:hypothetical protein